MGRLMPQENMGDPRKRSISAWSESNAPRYVYLLYDHDEDGPRKLCATLDPARLAILLLDTWLPADTEHRTAWYESVRKAYRRLAAVLARHDAHALVAQGVVALMDGWDGVSLQVVELDTKGGDAR